MPYILEENLEGHVRDVGTFDTHAAAAEEMKRRMAKHAEGVHVNYRIVPRGAMGPTKATTRTS